MSFYGRTDVSAISNKQLGGQYIVWSPTATQPPTTVFNDRQSAIRASMAMASKYGGRFTVCKIVGVSEKKDASYEGLVD